MAEAILLGWEIWPFPLMVAGIIGSWILHVFQSIPEDYRTWVYATFITIELFYYGIHESSAYDLAGVVIVCMLMFTLTGKKRLIYLSVITYLIVFSYDIINMSSEGGEFDSLLITRSMLHVAIVIVAAIVLCTLISRLDMLITNSDDEVARLSKVSEKMDDFLANLSHELRTPVNAVIGLSEVLGEENSDTKQGERINAISKAGRRMADEINDILDYTEIDLKNISVNNEVYMVASIVNDLMTRLNVAENYKTQLVVDIEPSVPVELIGDAEKIGKTLRHLITNALKYTRDGGVYAHIYATKRDYGVNLIFEIRDTGPGISEGEMEFIYDNFYQSDSGRTREVGGLGLGIPIVNGFAQAMSGFLTIESKQGEGTVARVCIPQKVNNYAPCIAIDTGEKVCIAGFYDFETTSHPRVRQFYMDMVSHLVEGLSVPYHRITSVSELDRLKSIYNITHIFVGTSEYIANKKYIDSLLSEMNVAVVADPGFNEKLPAEIYLMPKPFYGIQIANFLNTIGNEDISSDTRRMFCPGIKVLVVDDEPMNLYVARGIFESYKMKVTTVDSGYDALMVFSEEDFDIIFMDYMMPGMDGTEAMKRLKTEAEREKRECTVVALTANATSHAKDMFLSEGFDGFVAKPVDNAELERTLKRVLPKNAIVYEDMPSFDKTGDERLPEEEKSLYETSESEEPESDDELLIPGIDIEKGMAYCQNDMEFYISLLGEYIRDAEEKINSLNSIFEKLELKNYEIRTHAIKSTSRMIGAINMSERAQRLEEAAESGNTDYIKKYHPDFVKDYAEFLSLIAVKLTAMKNRTAGGEI
ncbi:MAG: response regulator [Lachnospiraceae bacterium]|nr:response regulator [Lachnospiraceae bacterium]